MKVNIVLSTIAKLYRMISAKHKMQLGLITVLTIGLSLVETLGISAIMPFISIASNPDLLNEGLYRRAFELFNFYDRNTFIIYFGFAIIAFYIFRGVYTVLHTYFLNRFSMAINKFFANKLFKIILSIPYRAYVQKNSSEFMQVINYESRQLGVLIMSILHLNTELFTITLVYILLLVVNWQMTLVLTVVLILLIVIFLSVLVKKNKSLSIKFVESNNKTIRIMMETFGNYKFARLKGNKNELSSGYGSAMSEFAKAQVTNNTLSALPKSVLETLGFSLLIGTVVFILILYRDAAMVIPTISMYALALYRLLPSVHRVLQNINNIVFRQRSLELIEEALNFPVENHGSEPLDFNESITLNNVSFSYETGGEVLKNISFTINKGEKIAVTGESGGGKSTLIDLIIGIHKPASGEIKIDGIPLTDANINSWRKKIGYIPQSIYLFDGTVAENVAYGSVFDKDKIVEALKKANIWEFLETKEGLQTRVGEGGIQLSGGQQQRIGIARALYDDPEMLVLDEATSALDNETEKKIMDEIYAASENKTLIAIAHRLTTVERCKRKIQVENGMLADGVVIAGD